ncbi:helix-turn-helix transcriptional regulator [Parafrankia soli]|uniref:helix-turn-helix transcriptional regulator n=1 Tax=Parafrankia soli TaxID=2599596 RepID=UPI001F5161B3|nr:AlpA family phage regulatory protein [Parafrankia soli]
MTASEILGFSRSKAYQLARAGEFPVPVIRTGGQYTVPTAPLRAALGIGGGSSLVPA